MMHLRSIISALVLVTLLAAVVPRGARAVDAVEPTLISSTATNWAITLTVDVARHESNAIAFTTRQFCYLDVCSFPGPTIQVKPGDIFNLTLVNRLGSQPTTWTHNTPHSPNSTNIHTHGLHISPTVDTVWIEVGPGESHTYNYVIPEDHAPGIHWYHTHHHGSSQLNVMGGLYGVLEVVPKAGGVNLPSSYTSLTKHLMAVSVLKFNQVKANGIISQGCKYGSPCTVYQGCSGTGSSPFGPFRAYNFYEMSAEMGDLVKINVSYTTPAYNATLQSILLNNGLYSPTISMAVGEYRVLRILNAASHYELSVKMGPGGASCSMWIIASDGVYMTSKWSVTRFWMVPATRYEVLITCSSAGTFTVLGEFGENGDQWSEPLVVLSVSGTGSGSAITDAELAAIERPLYLTDLTNAYIQDRNEVHFSQGGNTRPSDCGFALGIGSNCSSVWEGLVQPETTSTICPFAEFPGSAGGDGTPENPPTGTYRFVTGVGRINEWKVYGLGVAAHPFHLHVNHFQIIGVRALPTANDNSGNYFRIGDWRDTIPATDTQTTIRFRASDFGGEAVLHCHILRHEDQGMMGSIYICGNRTGGTIAGGCPRNLDSSSSGGSGVVSSSSRSASSSSTGTSRSSSSTASSGTSTSTGAVFSASATLVVSVWSIVVVGIVAFFTATD